MRQLDEIVLDVPSLIQPLLSEAYEAGRKVGYQEASVALKAKLFDVLLDNPDGSVLPVTHQIWPETPHVSDSKLDSPAVSSEVPPKRATPGSVKPAILKLLADAWDGSSVDDIVFKTGFKYNSVRGTLWALGNEGSASKRFGKWYISSNLNSDSDRSNEERSTEDQKITETE